MLQYILIAKGLVDIIVLIFDASNLDNIKVDFM